MKKRSMALLTLLAAVPLALLGGNLVLVSENARLKAQLRQSDELFQKMQQEAARVESEQLKMAKEHEALRNDAVSYVALNTTLQDERAKLQTRLAEREERLKDKEGELQKVQGKLEKLYKDVAQTRSDKRQAAAKELGELRRKVEALQGELVRERALAQYNVGVAYAQGERYDDAIEAYKKSLALNPKNAEAHYNLGALYARGNGDPAQAIASYRAYLELAPNADDRADVQRLIESLTASVSR